MTMEYTQDGVTWSPSDVKRLFDMMRDMDSKIDALVASKAAQSERCASRDQRIVRCERAIEGNGKPGLNDRVTKLETNKTTLVAAASMAIAFASVVAAIVF